MSIYNLQIFDQDHSPFLCSLPRWYLRGEEGFQLFYTDKGVIYCLWLLFSKSWQLVCEWALSSIFENIHLVQSLSFLLWCAASVWPWGPWGLLIWLGQGLLHHLSCWDVVMPPEIRLWPLNHPWYGCYSIAFSYSHTLQSEQWPLLSFLTIPSGSSLSLAQHTLTPTLSGPSHL